MMQSNIVMKKEKEEKESNLNKEEDSLIDRGFELMLKSNRREIPKPKTFQIKFGNVISLLNRKINFTFNFDLNITKVK